MSARPLENFLPTLDGVEVLGGGDGWDLVVGIDPEADPAMLCAVATARLSRQCVLLDMLVSLPHSSEEAELISDFATCLREPLQEVLNLLRAAVQRQGRCAAASESHGIGARHPGESS